VDQLRQREAELQRQEDDLQRQENELQVPENELQRQEDELQQVEDRLRVAGLNGQMLETQDRRFEVQQRRFEVQGRRFEMQSRRFAVQGRRFDVMGRRQEAEARLWDLERERRARDRDRDRDRELARRQPSTEMTQNQEQEIVCGVDTASQLVFDGTPIRIVGRDGRSLVQIGGRVQTAVLNIGSMAVGSALAEIVRAAAGLVGSDTGPAISSGNFGREPPQWQAPLPQQLPTSSTQHSPRPAPPLPPLQARAHIDLESLSTECYMCAENFVPETREAWTCTARCASVACEQCVKKMIELNNKNVCGQNCRVGDTLAYYEPNPEVTRHLHEKWLKQNPEEEEKARAENEELEKSTMELIKLAEGTNAELEKKMEDAGEEEESVRKSVLREKLASIEAQINTKMDEMTLYRQNHPEVKSERKRKREGDDQENEKKKN